MGKTKMRCNTCGKWFQSANAKDLTCPECVQKARKEKLAAKAAPPAATKPTNAVAPPPPPKPKQTQSGTNQWLDSLNDVKVGQPEQPRRPKIPSSPAPREQRNVDRELQATDRSGESGGQERGNTYREDRRPGRYRERDGGNRGPGGYREREMGNRGPGGYRESERHSPGAYRVIGGAGLTGSLGQRPRQPMEGGFTRDRGPRPGGFGEQRQDRPPRQGGPRDKFGDKGDKKNKASKPSSPPKPKREKIPPPPPFVPTPEQVTQVENRYLELANPTEFDGIRTQIAHELDIPKKAVKHIVKELRERQHIPSWWETQPYKGSEEELAKIKAVYEPMLPLPPIGVHKQIAEELSLKPGTVYQAIKAIRTELNLPQYNDPTLHGLEPQDGLEPQAAGQKNEQDEQSQTQPEAASQVSVGSATTEAVTTGTDTVTITPDMVATPEHVTATDVATIADVVTVTTPSDGETTA